MTETRTLTISVFVCALAVMGVVELAARRERSRVPTLGDLCAVIMSYRLGRFPVGRVALLGFWWWVGWHFFAR